MMDNAFLAYNSARLREGYRLFTEKMLGPNVTVGMSLAGALTPEREEFLQKLTREYFAHNPHRRKEVTAKHALSI